MSWFSDIAGRAEDLLNKVDKSAAVVLHKGETSHKGLSVLAIEEAFVPPPRPQPIAPPLQPHPTRHDTSPVKFSKAKQKEDEDQLLAFLNSPEPLAGPSTVPRPLVASAPPSNILEARLDVQEVRGNPKDPSGGVSADTDKSGDEQATPPAETPRIEPVVPPIVEPLPQLSPPEQRAVAPSVISSSMTPDLNLDQEKLRQETQNAKLQLDTLQRTLVEEQGERRRLQKKLDHWTSQVSESDGLLRELQSREADMKGLLQAKDSQLAVLRVRLQEADQQLESCRSSLLQTQSALEEQVQVNSVQQQSLDNLHSKLMEAEAALRQTQQDHARTQRENQDLLSQKDEEVHTLTDSLVSSQKSVAQLRGQNRDMMHQLGTGRQALDAAQQELNQYRLKAQRILHSKEKLIVALKERSVSSDDPLEESFQMVESPGTEAEAEGEALREELAQSQAMVQALRQELATCEQALALETQTQEDLIQSLQEKLRSEEQRRREAQLEMQQNTEELHYLREDLSRTKGSMQARIKDREAEIEKLRKQVSAKSLNQGAGLNGNQQRELEGRLKKLTESLIQKQTLVEALSTEKNALSMQMEVTERKLKELQTTSSKGPTHIVGISSEGVRERLPLVFMESPYDGSMARNVKRAYSAIDSFSIRMGSFLRRYPASRAFLFLYMALLHIWVLIVLCTYQPEIHPTILEKNRPL